MELQINELPAGRQGPVARAKTQNPSANLDGGLEAGPFVSGIATRPTSPPSRVAESFLTRRRS